MGGGRVRVAPGALQRLAEEQALPAGREEQRIVDAGRTRAVVGTPSEAADQIRALAAQFDVDEVMVNPVASVRRGTDPATAPGREATLELLAKELF